MSEKSKEKIQFSLTPEKMPKVKKAIGKRGSKYDPLLEQFMQSSDKTVRVNVQGIESQTLAISLRNIIKTRELQITVAQREDKVYLVKKK